MNCWINYINIKLFYIGAPTVAMAILARLGVNIAANIGFQYAAEMLPTVVRAQGVSLIHIIGYFAHIIGPYVIHLVKYKVISKKKSFYCQWDAIE